MLLVAALFNAEEGGLAGHRSTQRYLIRYLAMLNRGALIVRPAKPYIDWASRLDDSGVLPLANGERTVYLVPSFEDDDEAEKILRRVFPHVFENELHGWHTDEAAWPKRRTLAMFKKWFTIEMHSVVADLCGDDIREEQF